MSFDKSYPNRKDWLRPYRRSQAFDSSCRPHGGCPWCEGNRTVADLRANERADEELDEFWEEAL